MALHQYRIQTPSLYRLCVCMPVLALAVVGNESGDGDEDEYVGASGDTVGLAPDLRPRPKPKPAYKHKDDIEMASESDIGEEP